MPELNAEYFTNNQNRFGFISNLILYFCPVQKIGHIYKRNVYGVIGTLVFHILLFSTFLLADIDKKGDVKEEVIAIEFPDLIPEPEVLEEENSPEESGEQTPALENRNTRSNVGSNLTATENTTTSADEFFDDEYMKELEAAKQLVSDVNKQLSQDIVDMSDIEMPVETTEGMNPDSIKNVIYTGESNIIYHLEERYHVRLPVPVYLSQGGGTVKVDIAVTRQGEVIYAKARENSKIHDPQLFLYAQEAAMRTVFNESDTAPSEQKGYIQYTFVAQ